MTRKNIYTALTAVIGLALALLATVGAATMPAADVAAAITTPIAIQQPARDGFITFNSFSAEAVTADTTSTCIDVGNHAVIDALYIIDQGTTNTVTLTSKWSIDGVTTATGLNLVAANAADVTEMTQLAVFGRYFCVLADVTNSNPVTITVQAIAK